MVDILNLFKRIKKLKRSKKLLLEEINRLSEENDRLTTMLLYANERIKQLEEQAHEMQPPYKVDSSN